MGDPRDKRSDQLRQEVTARLAPTLRRSRTDKTDQAQPGAGRYESSGPDVSDFRPVADALDQCAQRKGHERRWAPAPVSGEHRLQHLLGSERRTKLGPKGRRFATSHGMQNRPQDLRRSRRPLRAVEFVLVPVLRRSLPAAGGSPSDRDDDEMDRRSSRQERPTRQPARRPLRCRETSAGHRWPDP